MVCRQEVVFIGTELDIPRLRARLQACLLTDEECAEPSSWVDLEDPFPSTELEDPELEDLEDGDGIEISFVK